MIVLFLLSVYATIKIAYQADRSLLYLNSNLMFTPELQASLKMKKIEILGREDGKVILVGGDNRVLEVGDNGVLRRTEFIDDAHKVTNITKLTSVTLSDNDVSKVGFILALVDDRGYKILPASGKCLVMNMNRELVVGTSDQCKLESSYFKLIITNEDIPFVPRNEGEGRDPEAMSHTGSNGTRRDAYADSRHNVAVHGMISTHIVRSSGRGGGMHTKKYAEDEGYGSDDRTEPSYRVESPKRRSLSRKGRFVSWSRRKQSRSHPEPLESDSTPGHGRDESDMHNEDSMKQSRSETRERDHGHGGRHQHDHSSPPDIHYYLPIYPPKGAQQPYQNPGAISAQPFPQNQLYTGLAPPAAQSTLLYPGGPVTAGSPVPFSPQNQAYLGQFPPFPDPNAQSFTQNQPYTSNPFVPVPFIPQNTAQPSLEESSTMEPFGKTMQEKIVESIKKSLRKRF